MSSYRSLDSIRLLLCGACLLYSACGGHSGLASSGAGGTTANPSGGSTALATGGIAGGATTIPFGGSTTLATGGTAGGATTIPSGGSTALATGGAAGGATTIFSGGSTTLATGGTAGGATTIFSGGSTALATGGAAGGATAIFSGGSTTLATGGAGGVSAAGGSTGAPSCVGVTCPSLPASCKKIVQDPGACCPTCTDTGCDPCADITCATGTHKETPVGACCPICVADPPDPCTQGQQNYAAFRTGMLDKVGTVKCQNSTDCVLLEENNACGVVCNVALPSSTADSFQSNLSSMATQDCASCPTPASVQCERMVPACMNGKCVAANPS